MADLFTLFGTISVNADSANRTIDGTTTKAGGLTKVFNKVGSAAVAVGKTVATGLAAGAAGVGVLLKSSISSYAEYEQLVGGIDTLFKDSNTKVMEYASNAYKTAGMSANKYMETVTSFSASLLQGLGGDTARAAEVADMAVTDMADNANKMGTPIESIQNAYQGFAKQNYTMLDNLKLGYGGTASEMARLINDSGVMGKKFKATAKNLKDIPFDKQIEAIHEMQTRMGITGTTALEASETIAGSWAALGSAWENLLIGMSDSEADMDALFNNVFSAAENVVKNVGKILPSFAKNLGSVLKAAGQKIADGWKKTVYPAIKDKLKATFGIELPDWDEIKERFSSGLAGLATWLQNEETQANLRSFTDALATLAGYTFEGVLTAFEWMINNGEVVGAALAVIATGLAAGAIAAHPYAAAIMAVVMAIGYLNSAEGQRRQRFEHFFDGYSDADLATLQAWVDAMKEVKAAEAELEANPLDDSAADKMEAAQGKADALFAQLQNIDGLIAAYNAWRSAQPENQGKDLYLDVPIRPSEDSESEMQTVVEGYDLEGMALLLADPLSRGELQGYLDRMNLSVDVLLNYVDPGTPHANGLDRVPFDGYRAVLHKDEAVLTAAEAAVWRKGQMGYASFSEEKTKKATSDQPITVNLTVNGVSSSPYEIAGEVRNALELLRWQS